MVTRTAGRLLVPRLVTTFSGTGIPVAVLPVQDVSFAIRELKRVARGGFRAAFIRPAFVNQRFPNHAYYNPLWKQLEDLGVAACIHPATGHTNPEWTSQGPYVERVAAHLRRHGHRHGRSPQRRPRRGHRQSRGVPGSEDHPRGARVSVTMPERPDFYEIPTEEACVTTPSGKPT